MTTTIRQAVPADASLIEDLLLDAARWVDALGVVMWDEGELRRGEIEADVTAGMYRIAEVDGVAAGAIRFQFEDRLFWPERKKLRQLYETFGFQFHSYRQVTSYYVARYVCDVEAQGLRAKGQEA
jgi:hypothetical protein